MNDLNNTAAIILAAGKGTRIGSHLPKVLYPLAGKPMISYVLDTFISMGMSDIYVVTGFRSEDVQASINRRAYFVHQPTPLGTGHAVSCALKEIPPDIDTIMVVNGDDSSFYTTKTMQGVLDEHNKKGGVISIVTTTVEDPSGLGRIIRDNSGKVVDIREEKEATEKEKLIKEVNIGFYIFNVDWIRNTISKIVPQSNSELYLTDTLAIAKKEGKEVNAIKLSNPEEWQGVNTQEQLAVANSKMISLRNKELGKQRTFIFDLDNTLIATDRLKDAIEAKVLYTVKNVFSSKLSDDKIKELFWQVYADHKSKNGWTSMPELGEQLAQVYGVQDGGSTFKRLLYTIPFKNYVKFGVKEMLASLKGKVVRTIIAYGDLVYQPIKLSIFNNNIDDYHVYEKLDGKMIAEFAKIYGKSNVLIVDDKLSSLEIFHDAIPSIQTIWLTGGPYKSDSTFKPDYTVNSISELAELINEL